MATDIATNTGRSTRSDDKLLWLSIIQGWAILLVVIGHVNAYNYDDPAGSLYPMAEWIHRACYSFHMPLFMFVSGGLLYFTRLKRGWKVPALYIDKAKRLLIPYIAFTIIAFCIKAPLSSISKRGVDLSANGVLNAFFDPGSGPLGELWFIGTLMWLMFMYPVYKVMLRSAWSELLLLAIALLPLIFELHIDIKGWFSLGGVPSYAFYFIGGMLFFKYDCPRRLSTNLPLTVGVTVLWIASVATGIGPGVITATLGIVMSFGWGVRLERFPWLFSLFRDHSFQIFLVGIFPQMFVELIIWKRVYSPEFQIPFYLLSCILALGAGVAMSRLASRIPVRWIRWCFGLK